MARPRNVSVSVYAGDKGSLEFWGISFSLPGYLKTRDGKIDEADRKYVAHVIEKALSRIDLTVREAEPVKVESPFLELDKP